jgi:hypothetical protein
MSAAVDAELDVAALGKAVGNPPRVRIHRAVEVDSRGCG